MKIDFDVRQLRKRILQPTAALMAEVASNGATPCGRGQHYAFRDNGAPVLAIAHCDYRDCNSDHFFAHKGKVWSSRLDDRLGVYVILDVLPALGIWADVLLTDDEETGQTTAQYFNPSNHHQRAYNWLFQFDRRGTGAVCYDYENMETYIRSCFKLDRGSFSDISFMDHLGVCGLNVGTAYYDEHSLGSYAVLAQLRDQVRRFAEFYDTFSGERIAHVAHGFNRYDTADIFDGGELEWHPCGDGLYYAEGLGREDYEIDYFPNGDCGADDGFNWRLSCTGGDEWFHTLEGAKARANDIYMGVR